MLASLPAVDEMLRGLPAARWLSLHPRTLVVRAVREALQEFREKILAGTAPSTAMEGLDTAIEDRLQGLSKTRFRRVINATGIVLHTNLGRAPLPREVLEKVMEGAVAYSNLEFDLEQGRRGKRYDHITGILQEITGAEDGLVVNNNAAAVLLCLTALAAGREVVVSRGELIEIGGSFRIPDVMRAGGACLKEVGTTNKTHLRDYETALTEHTALILKVHPSNYRIVGFSQETAIEDLVKLGRERRIPVMYDLGSGSLLDLARYGIAGEPTVQDIVSRGADIVTFSGDKLLGGPQGGIIVGRKEFIGKIQGHPLTRAVRVDKMTLAALEAVLKLYRDEETARKTIPALTMLTTPLPTLKGRASRLARRIRSRVGKTADVAVRKDVSQAGGGSLPEKSLETAVVAVKPRSVSLQTLEMRLRTSDPPVVARISDDALLLDVRTLFSGDDALLAEALSRALGRAP